MSTTHPVSEVEAYLDVVRARLTGLPDDELAELLDDVSTHVREVADEHGADHLHDRLGPPAQFGDELRAAAGYPPFDPTPVAPPGRVRFPRTKALLARRHHPRIEEAWNKLEPGWWVARGVIAGIVFFDVTNVRLDELLRFILLAGAGALSFRLGERRSHAQSPMVRRARITAEVFLVVLGLGYAGSVSGTEARHEVFPKAAVFERDSCLRSADARPIANLYAYDASGQPIPQFFLFDQDGRPVANLCGDGSAKTVYPRDANGAPIGNLYPQAQSKMSVQLPDGTVTWSPAATPSIVVPQLAPPATDTTDTTEAPQP